MKYTRLFLVVFGSIAALAFAEKADAVSFLSVRVENIYVPGAQIKWTTDVASDSHAMYGTASGNYQYFATGDCLGGTSLTSHCVNLTNLAASTRYYYKVKSTDANGVQGISEEFFFDTGASTGNTTGTGGTASVVPAAPSGLSVNVAANGTDVNLSWVDNSSNESEFKIYWRLSGGDWSYLSSIGANAASFTYYSHPTGTYEYYVLACNSSGCSGPSNTATVTKSVSDTTPPSVPSGLGTTVISSSQINLSWGASTDNTGVTGYKIFRNNTYLTTASVASYSDTGLSANTSYSYFVKAVDAAGNESSASVTVTAQTLSSGGSPTFQFIFIRMENATTSSVQIKWDTNIPATSAAYYYDTVIVNSDANWILVENRCDTGGMVYTHCITLNNLVAGGHYYYRVRSYDGSVTHISSQYDFYTVSGGGGGGGTFPAAPTGLSTTVAANGTDVNFSWVDNSTDETEFKIFWRPWGGSYSFLAYVGANVRTFTYYNHPNGTYEYYVIACHTSGCSGSPVTATVTKGSGGGTSTSTASQLYGYVMNAAGQPVSGADVRYCTNPATGCLSQSAGASDALGRWSLANPVTGSYRFWVAGMNFSQTVDISYTGGSLQVSHLVVQDQKLYGYAKTSGGLPVSGVEVRSCYSASSQPSNCAVSSTYIFTTDSTGYWFLPSPAPGYYGFYAVSSGVYSPVVYTPYYSSGSMLVADIIASSAGNTTTATTSVLTNTPPTIIGWGLSLDASGLSTIGMSFSVPIDQTTITESSVYLYATDTPDLRVPVLYERGNSFVSLKTTATLTTGKEYASVVRASVKSSSGVYFGSDYRCSFNALASGYLVACPSGGATSTALVSTPIAPLGPPPANAAIEGVVLDPAGAPLANVGVSAFNEEYKIGASAVSDANGKFKMSVVRGTHGVDVAPYAERKDYIRPALVKISVSDNEVKSLSFRFTTGVKTLTGLILFSDAQPVADAEVSAYSSATGQWKSVFTDASGRFTLVVGGGKWQVGFRPRSSTALWLPQTVPSEVIFTDDAALEVKQLMLTATRVGSKLAVRYFDQDGKYVPDVQVTADSASIQYGDTVRSVAPQSGKTDINGSVKFSLAAGTYYIRSAIPPERGLVNPEEAFVSLGGTETRELTIIARRASGATSVTLRGTAKRSDGTPTDAFVWAWSEKGRNVSLRAQADGTFVMTIAASDRWHIGAGKEASDGAYRASEITVDVSVSNVAVELVLEKVRDVAIAASASVSQPASQPVVVQVEDGAKVNVPSNAAAVSGTVSVSIRPTVEVPTQPATQVIGAAYDIQITDQGGRDIKTLLAEMEVVLPYEESLLEAKGVTEDHLAPSYYDDTAGVWLTIDNFTIDKTKNIIVARVNHLTRFAIIAAADTTPPSAPIDIAASALGQGRIKISWKSPTTDFRHAKIYRSERAGALDRIIVSETRAAEFTDAEGLKNGMVYYYTVRAVDPAGNESNNLNQTRVTVVGDSSVKLALVVPQAPPPAGTPLPTTLRRTLRQGMRGPDITILQTFLKEKGFYPEGIISGYFGPMTRRAVIRFQERYRSEILTPSGLSRGTGIVGPATRKKINEMSGQP